MKCISCGKELGDDARFCTECGTEQKSAAAESTEPIAEELPETDTEAEAGVVTVDEVHGTDEGEPSDEVAEVPADEAETPVETADEAELLPDASLTKEAASDLDEANAPIIPDHPAYESTNAAPPDEKLPDESSSELEEAPEEESAAPIKVGAGRLTGAAVIALFAAIFLILTSVMFCVKLGISGDIVKRRIEKMNLSTVLDSDLGSKSVSDTMFVEFGIDIATHGAADKHSFREFIGNTDLLGFSGEKAKGYTDYILSGSTSNPSVTVNNIVDFLAEYPEEAKEAFNYELQAADYNSIRSRLESRNAGKVFSIEEWSRKLHFELSNVKYLFSYITIGIFFALVLVLLIWIAVVVDKKGRHLMGFYGNVFTWSGLIVLLTGIAAYAGSAVANLITGQAVFYIAASVLLPFSLFAVATGVFELVLGFIFHRIKSAIKVKQKRDKAIEAALAERA